MLPQAGIRDHTPHTVRCQVFPLQSGSMCKTLLMPPRETDEKRFSLSKQTPSANTQDFSSTTQAETKTLNDLKKWESGREWMSG